VPVRCGRPWCHRDASVKWGWGWYLVHNTGGGLVVVVVVGVVNCCMVLIPLAIPKAQPQRSQDVG
jgi:hypothetical protein